MVQDWPRDGVPRNPSYAQPRYNPDAYDQRRYYDGATAAPVPESARLPPMAIDTALRTYCGIPGKQYFVAVLSEDGEPATFFSPGQKLEDHAIRTFFDSTRFRQVARSLNSVPPQPQTAPYGGFGDPYARNNNRYGADRRRAGDDGDDDDMHSRSARKRYRAGPYEDDGPRHQLPINRRKIRVQDETALWNFYDQRFKSCQQSACKLIAKAWVKAVEPKKQSTHPYTGSDEKAPGWWPKPWGNTKEDKVRHKEPDHLYKRERVHLLNHILSLVIEPNSNQHADVKKLQLNVKKLEECTNEALSGFYAESPTNSSKKQFLNEIFKVARQQERFKNGEIDGAVEVYVLDSDRNSDDPTSENDTGSFSREDDEQNASPSARTNNSQGFLQNAAAGPNHANNATGAQFMNDLPMRNNQPHPPVLHDMGPQHHDFVGSNLPVNGGPTINPPQPNLGVDMVASPHDRKPSVYGDYGNNGMYGQQWQPSTTSSETHQPLYPSGNNPAPSFVPPVPVSHPQSYVTSFEPMSRQGYDPNNGQMFRPADVPPPPVGGQQGYNYALPGVSEVIDSVPHKQEQYYYTKG